MKVDTWGFQIISSKHYLVGKCVTNRRHNMVEHFRQLTITKFSIQRQPISAYCLTCNVILKVLVLDGNLRELLSEFQRTLPEYTRLDLKRSVLGFEFSRMS